MRVDDGANDIEYLRRGLVSKRRRDGSPADDRIRDDNAHTIHPFDLTRGIANQRRLKDEKFPDPLFHTICVGDRRRRKRLAIAHATSFAGPDFDAPGSRRERNASLDDDEPPPVSASA